MPVNTNLTVQQPDTFQTIGNMLNLKSTLNNQQLQNLQIQQKSATLPADIARVNAESSQAQQMVAPTVSTANSEATTAAQTAQQQKLKTMQEHVSNGAKQLLALHNTGAGPDEVAKVVTDTLTNAGAPPEAFVQALAQIPKNPAPGDMDRFIVRKAAGALDMASQLDRVAPPPSFVDNGQQKVPIAAGNPELTGVKPGTPQGTPVQNFPPPTTPMVDPRTGQPGIIGAQSAPGSGPVATGLPPSQHGLIESSAKEAEGVRTAADQVGNDAYRNKQILNLLQNDKTKTGPIAATWHSISGGAFGDNYQEAGKWLEQQALSKMQAMGGGGSDARLAAASQANGNNKEFNAAPLAVITKYNDAATTALGSYRQGLDKAIGMKNENPMSLPAYKSAWAKNLDPNIFMVQNALRDNDSMELARIKQELGAKGMKELAQKRLNLMTLSETGRLPP